MHPVGVACVRSRSLFVDIRCVSGPDRGWLNPTREPLLSEGSIQVSAVDPLRHVRTDLDSQEVYIFPDYIITMVRSGLQTDVIKLYRQYA
jgi:hypothetical protein